MYRGSTTYHVRKFPGLKLGQEVSWDEVVRFGRGKSKNESRTTTRKRGCTKWPFSGGPPGTAFFDPIFSSWLIANLKLTKFWVFISRYFSPLNSEKLRSAKMLNLGSVRNSSNLCVHTYTCTGAVFSFLEFQNSLHTQKLRPSSWKMWHQKQQFPKTVRHIRVHVDRDQKRTTLENFRIWS